MLMKFIDDLIIPIYYISGPRGMVAAMRKVLDESGVKDDKIRTEGIHGLLSAPRRKSEPAMRIKIKRVYERPDKEDGTRILVDRLWPRGLTKAKASVDLWLKGIAPSTELRKWFGHDPDKWAEFKTRYRAELRENDEQVALLKREIDKGAVTLVYGAKDEEHNEALLLQELLSR
jgi:uncharacterized protein YeaO (DUF488 family)